MELTPQLTLSLTRHINTLKNLQRPQGFVLVASLGALLVLVTCLVQSGSRPNWQLRKPRLVQPAVDSKPSTMAKQMVVEAVGKHTATIIFSHGLGDTAAGWYPFAQSLKRQFTHIKWILPTAPISPVSLNNGMSMNSWFDIRTLTPPVPGKIKPGTEEDEAGMLASVRRISDLVTAEVDAGIPASRIVIGGFSQGAVISLLTGLTLERKLAGLVSLSGWLALSDKIEMMQTENARKLPLFWGHGAVDQVVQYRWGEASVTKLKTMGFKSVEFHTYQDMGHSLCEEEQRDLVKWLANILPAEDA